MPASSPLRPLLTWGALTVLAVLTSLAAVRLLDRGAEQEGAPEPLPEQAVIAVLRDWDDRRAAAYASGDVGALRQLYAVGSEAGARDVRLLRSYVARGLAVDGVRQQLLGVRVLDVAPHRITARVRDRLADASIRVGDERLRLPQDRPSTNDVVLVRQDDEWRVWSVDRPRRE